MQSDAESVEEYIAGLPDDRRAAISTVRDRINAHLPEGYVEQMDWGMISWIVPLETKPDTYNGKPLRYVALASQKHHMAVYLMGLYTDGPELARFQEAVRRPRPRPRHGEVLRALQATRGPAARRHRGGRCRDPRG